MLAAGPFTSVQDTGRPGLADMGVGPSGAADRGALLLVNRLLGNDPRAAALEATLGGLRLRARGAVAVAVTGAAGPLRCAGRDAWAGEVLHLRDGEELEVGLPEAGLRSYVGVRGGVDVRPVLGSRSTDVLSGLGPPPIAAGQVLPVGTAPAHWPQVDAVAVAPAAGEVRLRVLPGPRDDWFVPAALRELLTAAWTVTARSDRVGMRLAGPVLRRSRTEELPSEGVVRGALQVAADGSPALFLADHPLTGGYPVIAVVLDADVDRAAQARPGQVLRFARKR